MLLVDAGPLIAAATTDDSDHAVCKALLARASWPLVVPQPVVVEVAYFLGTMIGPHAEVAFARSIRDGELVIEPVNDGDWSRVAELVDRYVDMPLGLVDASVIALAERLAQHQIASLDHRHLGVVRPRHCERLTLLP